MIALIKCHDDISNGSRITMLTNSQPQTDIIENIIKVVNKSGTKQ